MNFIGVGPAELIVILIVALIFVGPQRLPALAAEIARTIREIRRYTASVTAEFTEVIQEFERETESERSQWREIGEGLTGAGKAVTDEVQGAQADAAGQQRKALPAPEQPQANGHAASEPAWQEIPEPDAKPAQDAPAESEPAETKPRAEEPA